MRGLASIIEINGPEAARLRAERARIVAEASAKATSPEVIRAAHAKRIAARRGEAIQG